MCADSHHRVLVCMDKVCPCLDPFFHHTNALFDLKKKYARPVARVLVSERKVDCVPRHLNIQVIRFQV